MAQKHKKRRRQGRGDTGRRRRQKAPMPFETKNYVLIVVGLILIAVGYAIMAIENEVDGFLSLYVSPILLLAGYVEIIYAIVWRPKASESVAG